MEKRQFESPKVLLHTQITFETAISTDNQGNSFPGLGWGVDGTPAEERGDFPGGGNTGGVFPGNGNGPPPGRRP